MEKQSIFELKKASELAYDRYMDYKLENEKAPAELYQKEMRYWLNIVNILETKITNRIEKIAKSK